MRRTLLLVSGAGRSGTSTVAGALSLLGAHVPGPHLTANPSNPKGFYESQWSADLHNAILNRANVLLTDGRPDAFDLVSDKVTDSDRQQIRDWLDEQTRDHPLTVLKDPRTVWTLKAWQREAAALDLRLVLVVMLRHPAQVLGSRSTHYVPSDPALGADGFAMRNLAGWLNAMLLTEAQTRGWPRVVVRYDELVADWRAAMTRIEDTLELGIADQLQADGPHPVDEFVDPSLNRHQAGWETLQIPQPLRELAESVWSAGAVLADRGGQDETAQAALDAVRTGYDAMYDTARLLTHDVSVAAQKSGRRRGVRAERRRQRELAAREAATPPTPSGARRIWRLGRVR